jgi:hypothetical protein
MTGTTYPRATRVEAKVKAATVASYFGGVALLALLQALSADANLISGLPDAVEVFVVPLLTSAVTFVGGWLAKHTYRSPEPEARHGL